MLPDRVSNPGPLTYESGALPIALHGPAEHVANGYSGKAEIFDSVCHYSEQLLLAVFVHSSRKE